MKKVLIIDDHYFFVDGLRHFLNTAITGITIIDASCAKDGLSLVVNHNNIDCVLLDLDLPDTHGMEILKQLKREHSLLPVIVLSASDNQIDMCRALNSGAAAYITKGAKGNALIHIMRLVMAGEIFIPSVLLPKLSQFSEDVEPVIAIEQSNINNERYLAKTDLKLTLRQKEILRYIAGGLSNKEIAYRLSISVSTVKSHVASLLRILNVSNRTKAAQIALKNESD